MDGDAVIAVGGGGPVVPGDAIAMRDLGKLYLTGRGAPNSSMRAYALPACAEKIDPLSPEITGEPII
jgi:hypothetical protein